MDQNKIYDEIINLIKEYNKQAVYYNDCNRLGLATSETIDGSESLTHEEFIHQNNNCKKTIISIETFGADGWFPQ